MNKIFSLSAIAAISLAFLSSCETDVDLTAPYASTTVVFGLLDPQADTQFVKITKTFLGDGNLNDYAMIRDSSEYKWKNFLRCVLRNMQREIQIQLPYTTCNPLQYTIKM